MPVPKSNPPIEYRYRFEFPDGTHREIDIHLDARTLALLLDLPSVPPAWTNLPFHQCRNCPLAPTVEPCPVAVNLATIVDTFKDTVSHHECTVQVQARDRLYSKRTTAQKGLSSIIGIYAVSSDCPIMNKLRPLLPYHLPFASGEESTYRTVSMYLLAQYLLMRRGKRPDWELRELAQIYDAISEVNRGLSARFRDVSSQDANANAVIILASFGEQVRLSLEDSLAELELFFGAYLNDAESTERS